MTTFAELGLSDTILRAVQAEGYETPTPIQAQAIPLVRDGHDLLGIAQTGTGKTAAFTLPILHRLAAAQAELGDAGKGQRVPPKRVRALILAPTRELAAQIVEAVRTYGRNQQLSVGLVVGGMPPQPQIRTLARGLDVLVATPGRLLDHLGTGAVSLRETGIVVLDEADQMLDMGFLPSIRKIMVQTATLRRQTLLFSATMPKEIADLARDFLRDPRTVSVSPPSQPVDRIDQKIMLLEPAEKRAALVEILADRGIERAIVFTRTKRGADKVTKHLGDCGLDAVAIHGDKSQGQRDRALNAFKRGQTRILVATDIAARGIDIDGVSHVINFELPNVPEAYIHRIGRTARAGTSGIAISLCDETERPYLRDIEKLIGRDLIPGGAGGGKKMKRPVRGRGRGAPARDGGADSAHAPEGRRPDHRGETRKVEFRGEGRFEKRGEGRPLEQRSEVRATDGVRHAAPRPEGGHRHDHNAPHQPAAHGAAKRGPKVAVSAGGGSGDHPPRRANGGARGGDASRRGGHRAA